MIDGDPTRELLAQVRAAIELEIAMAGPHVPIETMPTTEEEETVSDTHDDPVATVPERSKESTGGETRPKTAQPIQPPAAEGLLFESDSSISGRFESLIAADSPLRSFRTLADVEKWVANTVLIPLDEVRTNPVFGVGDPDADLMVIGEAPGAEEDKQGEPFVGRAGQLLNQILKAIGFERGDVYIANILKSRPPNNRDPLPAEVQSHIAILYKQIALIQPKIILCVGKTAGNSLLGKDASLKALRGSFHDFHGLPVLVTYHPAALLRNPQWKRPTWEDVQKLRALYDRLTQAA